VVLTLKAFYPQCTLESRVNNQTHIAKELLALLYSLGEDYQNCKSYYFFVSDIYINNTEG